jgi:hypothetical protein
MSFDVYLQVFEGGADSGFPTALLRRVFGECLVELEEDYWQLRYSDTQSSDLFLQPSAREPALVHSLSVHRPCADARLWQALYKLLESPGTLFHFPGCTTPMTRDAGILTAVPPSLIEALGTPLQIDSPEQLLQAVEDL